jgi:hypothetical protein
MLLSEHGLDHVPAIAHTYAAQNNSIETLRPEPTDACREGQVPEGPAFTMAQKPKLSLQREADCGPGPGQYCAEAADRGFRGHGQAFSFVKVLPAACPLSSLFHAIAQAILVQSNCSCTDVSLTPMHKASASPAASNALRVSAFRPPASHCHLTVKVLHPGSTTFSQLFGAVQCGACPQRRDSLLQQLTSGQPLVTTKQRCAFCHSASHAKLVQWSQLRALLNEWLAVWTPFHGCH